MNHADVNVERQSTIPTVRRGRAVAHESKSDTLESLVEYFALSSPTSSGISVSRERALQVTAFLCGARVIAEGCAQVPVRIRRQSVDNGKVFRTVAYDHWAHRLLTERPNGWMTSFEFREFMTLAAVIDRGGLAIKNTVGREVRELLPVPMGCWSVEQMADWSLRFRVDYADRTHGFFSHNQVTFLRGPSTDGYSGLPALRYAREALGLAASIEAQQGRLAGRGGNPSGVLSFDSALKPETKERLRETWSERYGPGGSGGIAILDQAASFDPITMSSVDAQHLDTRRFQVEEIGRALRVQPVMLMQADKASTFASAEQMFQAHVMHTIAPWTRRWEDVVRRDILWPDSALVCDLVERVLLRGSAKDMAEYYAKALGTGGGKGWMTQNEVRDDEGRDPLDDARADELPMGMMEQQPQGSDGNEP